MYLKNLSLYLGIRLPIEKVPQTGNIPLSPKVVAKLRKVRQLAY